MRGDHSPVISTWAQSDRAGSSAKKSRRKTANFSFRFISANVICSSSCCAVSRILDQRGSSARHGVGSQPEPSAIFLKCAWVMEGSRSEEHTSELQSHV